MQTNERFPLPQIIVMLAGLVILLILLLQPAPSLEINRYNAEQLQEVLRLDNQGETLYEFSVLQDNAGLASTSTKATHLWQFAEELYTTLNFNDAGGSIHYLFSQSDPPIGLFITGTGGFRLLDLTSGTVRQVIENIDYENYVFSSDERYLSARRLDGRTYIWDLNTGEVVSQLEPPDPIERYTVLAFSPDAKLLATAIPDWECNCRIIMLWDVATGKPTTTLGNVVEIAWSATFSEYSSLLVVGFGGGQSNGVQVWNIKTGENVGVFDGPRLGVFDVEITPNGRYVAGITLDEIWLWDLQAMSEQAVILKLSAGDFPEAQFNPQGDVLATSTGQGDLQVFDVETGEQIVELIGHANIVRNIIFSDDGQTLVSGGADGTIRLWRTDGSSPMDTIKNQSEPVMLPTVTITPTPAF